VTQKLQGCFKIGVLRTPGWEEAVGDGFAGPPPYTATRRLGRLAIADSLGLNPQTDAGRTLKQPCRSCPGAGIFAFSAIP
jgi:hypothetical protein